MAVNVRQTTAAGQCSPVVARQCPQGQRYPIQRRHCSEAIAGQPGAIQISQILAASGASVAPGLTELMLANSLCPGVSELDSTMSRVAFSIAEQSDIDFAPGDTDALAMASSCGFCWPRCIDFYGPWSIYDCDLGPFTGGNASCVRCKWEQCTRSRSYREVCVTWDCSGVVITHPDEIDGPKDVEITVPLGTPCPSTPN